MEKDADSMVVKPVEYAASEYSSASEPPPVSLKTRNKFWKMMCKNKKMQLKFRWTLKNEMVWK